jgi:hypothetical protein
VPARPATFRTPVTYPDGLSIAVTKITQQTVTQQGPGALTGQPMTEFTIKFTNGTTQPLNLDQVVVTATYGAQHIDAAPVYEGLMNDFSGSLSPGSSKTTAYAFTIPVKDLGATTLTVDFDGKHSVAVFTGAAR